MPQSNASILKHHALQNQRNNSARTFVSTRKHTKDVVGFYSLRAASVEFEQTLERIRKGLVRHEVPLVLLARLAVDSSCKGQGLGASLLQDVFLRFMNVQETIGARALPAHSQDDSAKAFYEKWGFVSTESCLSIFISSPKPSKPLFRRVGGDKERPSYNVVEMRPEDHALWERIDGHELDEAHASFPFSAKLARENHWSREFALKVVAEVAVAAAGTRFLRDTVVQLTHDRQLHA